MEIDISLRAAAPGCCQRRKIAAEDWVVCAARRPAWWLRHCPGEIDENGLGSSRTPEPRALWVQQRPKNTGPGSGATSRSLSIGDTTFMWFTTIQPVWLPVGASRMRKYPKERCLCSRTLLDLSQSCSLTVRTSSGLSTVAGGQSIAVGYLTASGFDCNQFVAVSVLMLA